VNSERRQLFERFLSLAWYETLLRFIATFIAKTSELLLAGGLVVSTANFLTDGHVLDNPGAAGAWAWVQALALDSSLGISFYYVLQSLKQRDWVKFALYLVLTGLLTLVAGSITNVDIFSHAIHTTMSSALTKLGFDVGLLSTLRSIAVVGFVLMSRLKDVSFKDLYQAKEEEPSASSPAPVPPEPVSVAPASDSARSTFTIEEVALLYRSLHPTPGGTYTVEPAMDQEPLALPQQSGEQHQPRQVEQVQTTREPSSPALEPALPHEAPLLSREPETEPAAAPAPGSSMAQAPRAPRRKPARDLGPRREERLEHAYRSLLAERGKVSARALAERAYVHRSTCAEWLEARTRATPSSIPPMTRPAGEEAESVAQNDGSHSLEGTTSPGDGAVRLSPGDTPGRTHEYKGTDTAQEGR
jgi:hypothetical protein